MLYCIVGIQAMQVLVWAVGFISWVSELRQSPKARANLAYPGTQSQTVIGWGYVLRLTTLQGR